MLSPLSRRATQPRRPVIPSSTTVPSKLSITLPQKIVEKKALEKTEENVIILGAAGRDFHDFQTYWSVKPNVRVTCFTGTQIPGISHRTFPKEMCQGHKNNNKYPQGIEIYPQEELEELIERFDVDTCALAYSDLSYDTVQSLASRVNAAGCSFVQLPPQLTMLESTKPVVSICASRTGVGKSQTTRYVAKYFRKKGLKVAVVRHPMPYDSDLNRQRFQRYVSMDDMDKYDCTVEEREEYYGHIRDGNLLFSGVDYEMILRQAEKEADIIIWDGGNNDAPFFAPDLHICLVDSLRPMDESHYYPGETNLRMADVVLICKVNELPNLDKAFEHANALKNITKSSTPIFFGHSVFTAVTADSKQDATALIKGRRVLVVEDGPTLTHGGMKYGAGYVMSRNFGAAEIVDPRPFAKGSLKEVFANFPHLENVLPAMGYGDKQIKDLEATIQAVDCDTIVLGTPSNISNLIDVKKPFVTSVYELEIHKDHKDAFHDTLDSYYERHLHHHPREKNA